jgi:carbon monoxide dehydrogenase subunit G
VFTDLHVITNENSMTDIITGGKQMNSVTQEITINAPRQRVWEILANIGAVHEYSQNVQNSYYVSDKAQGVGAARKCELGGSTWVEERAIAWQDNRGYTLQVAEGEGLGPLESMVVAFELSDAGRETKVRQTMSYNMKGGILRPLLNALARGQMRKAVDVNLNGLKTFVEGVT